MQLCATANRNHNKNHLVAEKQQEILSL